MTDYYLDASALVKRYTDEPGSSWVGQITDPHAQNIVLLAEITLAAKHRAPGGIAREQMERILSRFLQDCDEFFLLLPVDRAVIDLAVELAQNHRLRGYDAVQLATALEPIRITRVQASACGYSRGLKSALRGYSDRRLVTGEILKSRDLAAPVFVTSDADLLTAARAKNLNVENPLEHS